MKEAKGVTIYDNRGIEGYPMFELCGVNTAVFPSRMTVLSGASCTKRR